MDKIQQWISKIFDMVFWQTVLSHFQWVDWVTTAFLVMGLIYGMRKGLMRELVEILELVLILAVTLACQKPVTAFFKVYLPSFSEKTIAPAAFMVTALCAWFVVSVIDKYMQKWVHAKISGFLKVAGGGILGALHFFLVWSFVSQAILLMPVRGAQTIYDAGNSTTGVYVKQLAPAVYRAVSNPGQILPPQS